MLLFGSQSSGVDGKAYKGSSTTLFSRLLCLALPLPPPSPYPHHHHLCPSRAIFVRDMKGLHHRR